MKGYLLLEDGMKLEGTIQGCFCPAIGEIVFNTGMTGYQEIVTDPSYFGQIVVLTYPMIGNYGNVKEFDQSEKIQVKGLIVKEMNTFESSEAGRCFLEHLESQNIPVLTDVDTRHLTKHIREKGAMLAQIVTETPADLKDFNEIIPVYEVTTKKVYNRGEGQYKIAVLDFGIKENILRQLEMLDFELRIYPATSSIEEIIAFEPNGIFLSNGPGDPSLLPEIIQKVKWLSKKIPTFGICLGHQLLGLAYGAHTEKLHYGHRGSNHPIKDIKKDRVFITSQNHGYVINKESMSEIPFDMTHYSVNDYSVEGMKHHKLPIFSVQYHPEASPGPDDSNYLFKSFENMVMEVSYDN